MRYLKFVLSAILLALTTNVNATTYTYGNLTSDDTTNFITDTVSGREYLRFDTFNLSYADTVAAVGTGGLYEGYSIATSDIADDFYSAILGVDSTPCTGATNYNTLCGGVTGWVDDAFGASYGGAADLFFYLSTNQTPGRPELAVGHGLITTSFIADRDDWSTITASDSQNNINFLLYNDDVTAPSTVPVPAAAWLFGSALLGFFGFSRRKANA